jgi:hypothetical protein
MGGVCRRMLRHKPLEAVTPDTSLHRCLGLFDLTFMGIGAMVGSGIYVMTGIAAKNSTGTLSNPPLSWNLKCCILLSYIYFQVLPL